MTNAHGQSKYDGGSEDFAGSHVAVGKPRDSSDGRSLVL